MEDIINRNPCEIGTPQLLELLADPGRFGCLELGGHAPNIEAEEFFGEEDGPEPPDEPEEGWDQLAAHHGHVTVDDDGKIDCLSYNFRVLTPTPMCFQPEPEPNARIDELFAKLGELLQTKVGKPTKRTKKTLVFEWDGGELAIERTTDRNEPWDTVALEVRCHGSAPHRAVSSAVENDEARVLKRPDPDALKRELNGVTPDCFDCGMQVTVVEVRGDVPPYEVTIAVRFDPYTGDEVEESFTLSVDDPIFDVSTAAVESMGDLLDAYR